MKSTYTFCVINKTFYLKIMLSISDIFIYFNDNGMHRSSSTFNSFCSMNFNELIKHKSFKLGSKKTQNNIVQYNIEIK